MRNESNAYRDADRQLKYTGYVVKAAEFGASSLAGPVGKGLSKIESVAIKAGVKAAGSETGKRLFRWWENKKSDGSGGGSAKAQ